MPTGIPGVSLCTSARREGNLAVKASKASRILSDGLRSAHSSELTPSRKPTGHRRLAPRGCCDERLSPAPFVPTEPFSSKFWDDTTPGVPASRREASLHERERLQGFLFRPCLFWFSPVVLKHGPSLRLLEPFACMKCPFFLVWGRAGNKPQLSWESCHVVIVLW